MNGIFTVVISIIGIAVIFLGIIWLGFQIEPESFPPHPEKTKDEGIVKVPPDIPEPEYGYLYAFCEHVSHMASHLPVARCCRTWGGIGYVWGMGTKRRLEYVKTDSDSNYSNIAVNCGNNRASAG